MRSIVAGQPVWNLVPSAPQRLCEAPACRHQTRERQYVLLSTAYRRIAGVASGDEVAGRMQMHCDQSVSKVAQWIVTRKVLSFCWQSQTLLPLFQFDLANMTLRPCVSAVIAELTCTFDDWELALWFAEPNAWLGDAVPAERVRSDPQAVLAAARADRFIAQG